MVKDYIAMFPKDENLSFLDELIDGIFESFEYYFSFGCVNSFVVNTFDLAVHNAKYEQIKEYYKKYNSCARKLVKIGFLTSFSTRYIARTSLNLKYRVDEDD